MAAGVVLIMAFFDFYISFYVRDFIYTDMQKLPVRPYGLVLGTAKYSVKGSLNEFYVARIDTAADLYKNNSIEYLILSGDNRTKQYNEPRAMFYDLQKRGVDGDNMVLDFAGFRTLDSIVRSKEIFKAQPLTIISQKFHCERALFIAKIKGLDAICFTAPTPAGYKLVRIREFFARTLTFIDLITNKQPYFLGKSEPLPARS